MGVFAVGDVVLCFFPFSDVAKSGRGKKRPCLVVAFAENGDAVIAQITSKFYGGRRIVKIMPEDFRVGSLRLPSYVRPDKLFTIDSVLIEAKLGSLKQDVLQVILAILRKFFSETSKS